VNRDSVNRAERKKTVGNRKWIKKEAVKEGRGGGTRECCNLEITVTAKKTQTKDTN
jgi:hypothetical protein